jgi:hypothetical protein
MHPAHHVLPIDGLVAFRIIALKRKAKTLYRSRADAASLNLSTIPSAFLHVVLHRFRRKPAPLTP